MILLGWISVWVLEALIIAIAAYLLPGVRVKNAGTALLVALVLSIVNLFIRPIIALFALPITILTFGFFSFVISALMVLLTARIVKNFEVDGFWNALIFSFIISLARVILASVFSI